MQLTLTNKFPNSTFTELQSIDSTNNYALGQIHAGLAQNGNCYFAHEQTAGKGQRGKLWKSQQGQNIHLSLVLSKLPLLISEQFLLSAAMSSAVFSFFEEYAGDETKIKWPNDLYWKNRKAGGILIENIVKGSDWQWAVIGIGININQTEFPPDLPNPVSLKQITGNTYDLSELARKLCERLHEYYELLANKKTERILDFYRSHLFKRNQPVRLKKGNRIFEAVIKNVSKEGKLVIEHGIEEELDLGQVEWFF